MIRSGRHNERDGVSNDRNLDCLFNPVCSGADQRKHQRSTPLAFVSCEGNSSVTGKFPTQRASNAENVSILWGHHVTLRFQTFPPKTGSEQELLLLYIISIDIHGWPSTQPGSLLTALKRRYTQPCSLFSRGTAMWTMGARLCEQWGTAVCKCRARLCRGSPVIVWSV